MHGEANSLLAALSVSMAACRWCGLLFAGEMVVARSRLRPQSTGTLETRGVFLKTIVLCLIVIPWPYVLANYVKRPGDRWRSTRQLPFK